MRILWIVIGVISGLILAVLAFVFIPRLLQPEPVELDGKYRSAVNGQGTRSFWTNPLTSVLDVIDIGQKTISCILMETELRSPRGRSGCTLKGKN